MSDTTVRERITKPAFLVLAIPQVILFGGMLVMLIVHPNAARSGVQSTRAVVVNGVLLVGWLLLSFVVLPRVVTNVRARASILATLAVAAIVVLVVPTLRDKKVVEAFPMPEAAVEAAPGTTAPDPAAGSEPAATEPPTTTTMPQPIRVSTGGFRGIDHDAIGRASIYRLPDRSYVVGLEDIDIEPGPDYQVYVVPGTDRESPGDGTHLAGLRGNQGTQYYEVPRDVTAPGADWTVLVWCRAFGVPVAAATQRAA
jgi:hypothetical protein